MPWERTLTFIMQVKPIITLVLTSQQTREEQPKQTTMRKGILQAGTLAYENYIPTHDKGHNPPVLIEQLFRLLSL